MEEPKHVRRVRYRGTHPHTYQEKYKELEPERYAEDVAHILESGKTPAGTHIPICVREILEFLQIRPGQTGLDATLGYGGHAQKMLERLGGSGHLFAIDVDAVESAKTQERLRALGYGPEILTIQHRSFADADTVAPGKKFDFVLADLGVSSMQIDNPERGFSFQYDGPLDLRLDSSRGITAAERLRELSEAELADLLRENADEPYAAEIAGQVRRVLRAGGSLDTTKALAKAVADALPALPAGERRDVVKRSCQRTFQALRIDVNGEFEALYQFLNKLPDVLCSGGRAAILTFHSGEDRLVKKAFQQHSREGLYRETAREVLRPSAEECFRNPRARSAKLRWAIRA